MISYDCILSSAQKPLANVSELWIILITYYYISLLLSSLTSYSLFDVWALGEHWFSSHIVLVAKSASGYAMPTYIYVCQCINNNIINIRNKNNIILTSNRPCMNSMLESDVLAIGMNVMQHYDFNQLKAPINCSLLIIFILFSFSSHTIFHLIVVCQICVWATWIKYPSLSFYLIHSMEFYFRLLFVITEPETRNIIRQSV